MEESELEEGEACSYNITNDYGGTGSIDPDNDFSYIDEKLENILGHFQKDFEGNFSAENLGAKFGGYGSFLPTYQRSPVWSRPKTPAKPLSSTGTTRSPNNVLGIGESQSGNAASSSVPKRAKSGLASTGNPKKSMKSKKPNSSSRQESATKKPGVFSKQNSLKLRIKMGSDSVSAEKNAAAIYNGLGLDMSPSLSLDNNSLSGSEGMLNGEPRGYSPLLSPAGIINVMTSLPVDHRQLLSPLSGDLIRFVEKEKTEKVYKHTSPFRFTESSAAMVNGLESKKVEEKPLIEKKRKTVERNSFPVETNVRRKNGNDATTIKEPVETNTSYPIAAEKEKLSDASKDNYNGAVKSEMVNDGERRSWGITRHKDLGPYHENPKTSSAGSVREDKKQDDVVSGYLGKVGKFKRSKASDSIKKELGASKVKNVHKAEPEQHSSRKRKSDQIEQEPSKSKELKSSVVIDTKMNGQAEKKEVVAPKPQNGVKNPEDAYKDFFGDIGDSEEEDVKDSRMMSEKRLPVLEGTPEKSSFPSQKETQNIGPGATSLPKVNPVIIQEHWVACDKCGKWRLLPFGVLPEDLPEKWMCTMLNWLPDVNYCHVPEDETTKALYAMYQIPPPDSQAPVQSNNNPSGPKPQLNQGDDSVRKKKKKGLKKIESGIDKEGSRTITETNKKTIQPLLKNGNINNSHDLAEEKQKQKEKGRASDHHSDDSRILKANKQRNVDHESSMLAKKMKIESFLFPEESEQGNVRPSSSSGVPDKKPKLRVSSIVPKEEGGASDTGNSDSKVGIKKRKSHGSRMYSENENHERKKARVLKDGKEPSGNWKSEKSEKKNRSHSKREYGLNVQNSIAAASSSSKISDSHKHRNTSQHEAKSSPVESVSSSPMRISNPEKNVSARIKKEEPYDANVFAAGTLRRFSDGDGEDDGGGSDRSQTRIREKHGPHESYARERGEPSLDANFEEGGHKELLRKLDHSHDEAKQSSDHHHSRRSSESLPKKSGKSSSSRSKDKSIRSDSRDGPRLVEKKIYDGSPDMVVRPNIPKPYDAERISERSNSRADIASDREASQPRPPSRGLQGDSSMLSAHKKVEKCSTSAGNVNNIQAEAQVRRKNEPSPSPLRKEVTSAQVANNTLKEAKDLKHTADRLKNTVSNIEHIELYFQACLKFLHAAYLFEMSSNESANRQGETMVQSMKIYSSTANLCGFCAHEYEKSKDMGAAALAYKCMEVAYMRVVNSSYTSANRLRSELQTSLQMVPPGESPSSSASDVDNVNHPATGVDKIGISRSINSPLVAGNHVISAQNRSNILRLLQFAQDTNLAMDASRKSRLAFAACIENLGEAQQEGEGIVSIRTALDFNFQDMEGFLRLVKLAMKANNR